MGRLSIWFLLLLLAFIGIQFIEVDRNNPPVTQEISAPEQVKNILKNSCWDCHSNETKWPWYSHVAPVSWFIADDVHDGRKHLNFSEWDKYNEVNRDKKKHDILDEINQDDMPLKMYTYLHPNSPLDISQKTIIRDWVEKKNSWR